MNKTSIAAAFLLAVPSTLEAQVRVENETLQRVITQVVFSNSKPPVRYRINYGPLKWRDEYINTLESEGVGHYRLGTGPWAELNTNAVLSMGTTQIAAGRYYVGIQRVAPKEWNLTLMHADSLDRRRFGAEFTGSLKPDITVPLRFAPLCAAWTELSIELVADQDEIGHATLRIRFGTYQVETPVFTEVHEWPRSPVPKFETLNPDASKTTASGLVYEVVRAGKGDSPKSGDGVIAHYTGWLADGTFFDSSHERGEPPLLQFDTLIRGWQEGLQLMTPGSVFKLSIPPELGYGAKQTGPIPANSTLVFLVEFLEVLR